MKLNKYNSVSEATRALHKKGYKDEFKLEGEQQLRNLTNKEVYTSKELTIVEYHRFEGESNPSDMSIVYAIETEDGTKGTIISSYGMYADMDLVAFIDKVKIKERESQKAGNDS